MIQLPAVTTLAIDRSRLRHRPEARPTWSVAKVLRAALAVFAVAALAAFLIPAVLRLSYPFQLQLTEPASLEEVQRILNGQPLYVAPTLQHVPLTYGPVYFYLSAAVASVTGVGYLPLRFVSLLASIGTLLLTARLVRRETGSPFAALVSAGLLAATYPLGETALDLGRVDALFAFFLVAAISLARMPSSSGATLLAGVAMGLAAVTKLPIAAAPLAVALAAYLAWTVRARTLLFVAGFAATLGLVLLLLRLQSGPWPTWYMWDLPSQHAVNDHGDLLSRFWFSDILPRFTFPLLLGPVFVLMRYVNGDKRPLVFYVLVGGALIGGSWASRSNNGGATNVLLPTHFLIAVLLGLGLYAALHEVGQRADRLHVLQTYVLSLCVLQFGVIAYNPRLLVPYRSEEWAAERLTAALANLPGELFAPDLDGYVRGTGKGEQPLLGAVVELTGGYGGLITPEGQSWNDALEAALRQKKYSHVVLHQPCCEMGAALTKAGYVAAGPLFPPGDDYWLWTNGRTPSDLQVFVPGGSAGVGSSDETNL